MLLIPSKVFILTTRLTLPSPSLTHIKGHTTSDIKTEDATVRERVAQFAFQKINNDRKRKALIFYRQKDKKDAFLDLARYYMQIQIRK